MTQMMPNMWMMMMLLLIINMKSLILTMHFNNMKKINMKTIKTKTPW